MHIASRRTGLVLVLVCLTGLAPAAEPATDVHGDPLPLHAVLRLGTTRFHHQSSIQDVAFSPDGRMLASAASNQDTSIALWEVPSGRLSRRLIVTSKDQYWPWTNALAFSPDGRELATVDIRGRLHVWNVSTGAEHYSIEAHPGNHGATAVAFSNDGKWLASGGSDGVVRVSSTESGHELLSFDTLPPTQHLAGMGYQGIFPPGCIAALSFSPDGNFLAVGIAQQLVRTQTGKTLVWDVDRNQPVRWLDEPEGFLSSLAYTPEGNQLLSGGNSTVPREKLGKPYPYLEAHVVKLRVWDPAGGQMVRQFSTPEKEPGLGAIALSRDGRTLATGYEHKILVWDFDSGSILRSIEVPKWRGGRGLAISPDGRVVCAPLDNTLGLWSTATGESLLAETPSHTSFVNTVAFVSRGKAVVTSGDATVRVWDATTGRQIWSQRFGGDAYVNALAVSPDGSLIAAGGQTEQGEAGLRVYQSTTGEVKYFIPMFRKKWYANHVRALAFAPDGRTLAVVRDRPKQSNTYDMDFVDVETGKRLKEVACGFFAGVRPVAFTPDGASLYTIGHQDAIVNTWDLNTGVPRKLFTAIKPPPEAPDGKRQRPFVSDVAFTPDLKTVIASQGRELIFWDLARGELIAAVPTDGTEHGGQIVLSKDGRWLAMTDLNYAGDPGSDAIRLFDLGSRSLIATLDSGQGRPNSFAFSPDGTRLVTGMSDGTALVWDLATAVKSRRSD
jgi:WD40 repeat protein